MRPHVPPLIVVVVALALVSCVSANTGPNIVYDVVVHDATALHPSPPPPPSPRRLDPLPLGPHAHPFGIFDKPWLTNNYLRAFHTQKTKFNKGPTAPAPAKPPVKLEPAIDKQGHPTDVGVVAGHEAQDSCYDQVHEFSEDHVCFSKAVVENEPHDATNKPQMTTNIKSCRSVAFFLDRLFANHTYSPDKNHAPKCGDHNMGGFWQCFDENKILARIQDRTAARESTFWHFRLPADIHVTKGDEHNIGHHWTIEMTFRNGAPSFLVYMSYQDMYPLSNWLDQKEKPAKNKWAGGKHFSLSDIKPLLHQTQELINLMKDDSSCSTISRVYEEITSVSFKDEQEPPNCRIQDPANARVLVAELKYDVNLCRKQLTKYRAECKPGQTPSPRDLFY